jgi:hypothetical protein
MDIWEATLAMQYEKALDIASISLYSVAALGSAFHHGKHIHDAQGNGGVY